jgi:hypothetical protein
LALIDSLCFIFLTYETPDRDEFVLVWHIQLIGRQDLANSRAPGKRRGSSQPPHEDIEFGQASPVTALFAALVVRSLQRLKIAEINE